MSREELEKLSTIRLLNVYKKQREFSRKIQAKYIKGWEKLENGKIVMILNDDGKKIQEEKESYLKLIKSILNHREHLERKIKK